MLCYLVDFTYCVDSSELPTDPPTDQVCMPVWPYILFCGHFTYLCKVILGPRVIEAHVL
jgi:hypothetical protein